MTSRVPASLAGAGRQALDALAARPRTVSWVLLAVAGLLTGLIVLALAGAAWDDAGIDARTGQATAQVLAVTSTRTLVRFATPDGRVHSPEQGVAYPSGLQGGQLVRVHYNRADPDQVRVAGRTWVVGVAPAVITLLTLWLLVAPVVWWLRRHRRHRHRRFPGAA